ncbi:MAG: AAA family ATPase [Bacteroidales bacterium]|nr:AAA family ATPase [Bacteroidales bacterium]
MIKNLLAEKLIQNLGHPPTRSQDILIGMLSEFMTRPDNQCVFIIKGYAGTGKTSAISALVKTLEEFGIKSVLLAPTGRAAKVFSHFSGKPAYTIHKKIYRQKSSKDGFGRFMLEKNLHTNTVFIVDEASMISNQPSEGSFFGSGRLLDDLMEYVYNNKGCKLIITGDTAQLPPVNSPGNPALDKRYYSGYLVSTDECELTEVVRQQQQSGILENATRLRTLINTGTVTPPKFNLAGYKDICSIQGNELTEQLEKSYEEAGTEQTIIINRSNKRSNMYNAGVRAKILYRESELSPGDMLMAVKNNYYWIKENENLSYIANGDMLEITRIKKYEENYGFRFADVSARLTDYDIEIECKIMLDTLNTETASLSAEQNKELFYRIYEDYAEIKPKQKGYNLVKENPFFNALQVKFAYAVTCHKAQGGQWKHVFIDQGYVSDNMISADYLKWLYTALTRSTQKVFLVNFPEKYFN